jgi:uncharacterized membrane protein YidH (DUF202 family)
MERPNPYAAPVDEAAADERGNDHEPTRLRLIGTESNIRAIGSLVILGGGLTVPSGIAALSASPIAGVVTLVVAGIAFFAGASLRAFQPIGRILYTVIAGLAIARSASMVTSLSASTARGVGEIVGLLLQLLIIGGFLAILWGTNAREIFTDHYRRVVIPATQHIKPRMSLVLAVLVIIVFLLFVSAIAAAVLT